MKKAVVPLLIALSIGLGLIAPKLWFMESHNKQLSTRENKLMVEPPKEAKIESFGDNRAAYMLFYDQVSYWRVSEIDGLKSRSLMNITMSYKEGNGRVWNDLFGHSPEICLPASGAKLIEPPFTFEVPGQSEDVRCQRYSFSHPYEKEPIFVYKLVWLGDGGWDQVPENVDQRSLRLKRLLGRKLSPPATLVLTSLEGYSNPEQADKVFERFVIDQIR